eukprot:GHRR01021787.1.p1 GENE.GHRR01021787.1~~GHRR01021787.1.p1  ORF type:complete len:149 (+),score=42.14 GHRR01021787.1:358-804(+)
MHKCPAAAASQGAHATNSPQQQSHYQVDAKLSTYSQRQQNQEPEQLHRHHIDPDQYDMNYWHYQPWWLQPHMIIATGIGFLVISLLVNGETTLKTLLLAAGPLSLYWGIFLFLLPRTFKSFAVDYMETHPDVEQQAGSQQQPAKQQQN